MVNEMLTWMERSPVPFVATTNLSSSLDPATARRFLFKVEFKPLDYGRSKELFRRYFGTEAPAGLQHLADLTPGDFALVKRKAALLGEEDPGKLLRLLSQELAARETDQQPIGFCLDRAAPAVLHRAAANMSGGAGDA